MAAMMSMIASIPIPYGNTGYSKPEVGLYDDSVSDTDMYKDLMMQGLLNAMQVS